MSIEPNCLFRGTQADCKTFLGSAARHYVYLLRRPDGRPFYVGKGCLERVFQHENEARHPNDRRSNAHKLNVIRSIWRSGGAVEYEIDFCSEDEAAAYGREAKLISQFKRLHEGGPLTNLAPGGGSLNGTAPESKAKHSATLAGAPTDNPERATLNGFILSIAKMNSVVVKPSSQFTPRPTQRYPSKSMAPTLRQAVALVASASANGVFLDGSAQVPRRLCVQAVEGLVENGVSCDIVTSGLGILTPTDLPADEAFDLSAAQSRRVVELVGRHKCFDLGVIGSM